MTNLLKSGECQAFSQSWYNQNTSFMNELYAMLCLTNNEVCDKGVIKI